MTPSSLIIALCLATGASAFTNPAPVARVSTVAHAGKADLELAASKQGVPTSIFDPLGLAELDFIEGSNDATIAFLRHAEIKHGRVAMAAFVGYCVHAQGIVFPFDMTTAGDKFPSVADVGVPGLWDAIPEVAKWQIILFVGTLEWWSEVQFDFDNDKAPHYLRGGRPGEFPSFKGVDGQFLPLNLFDPFGLSKKMSPEQSDKRLSMEINNGRAAMMGMAGFMSASKVDESVPFLAGKIAHYDGNYWAPFEANFHMFQ